MKEIYKKTARYSLIACIVLSVIGVAFVIFYWIGIKILGDFFLLIDISILTTFGTSLFFRMAAKKITDVDVEVMDESFQLQELIVQGVPSPFSKFVLVNSKGQILYHIQPTDRQPIRKWLTIFPYFATGLLTPITYDIIANNGARIASIQFKNEWKRTVIWIGNHESEIVGRAELPLLKNTFRHTGTLFNAEGKEWRTIRAKSVAGDIDIRDDEGLITASYRFGLFPYAMHEAFQAVPNNYHVRLGAHISEEERLSYVGIFMYQFINASH